MGFCIYESAQEAWRKLLRWISLCRIPEMIEAGKTIRNHFWGILNEIRLKSTNGIVEAKNNSIHNGLNAWLVDSETWIDLEMLSSFIWEIQTFPLPPY